MDDFEVSPGEDTPRTGRGPSFCGTQAGTLELEAVWLVVDEFKLEGNEGACEGPDPAPDCGKFEAEPHLLAVPLEDGETETVIEETAPPGTFTWLKFETKAVAGNADVQAAIQAEGMIADEGAEAQTIFVVVDPGGWFLDEEGSAMDLRTLDYDASGLVHKLEVKLEDGFTKIELGG